jgi:hypothetical protein
VKQLFGKLCTGNHLTRPIPARVFGISEIAGDRGGKILIREDLAENIDSAGVRVCSTAQQEQRQRQKQIPLYVLL